MTGSKVYLWAIEDFETREVLLGEVVASDIKVGWEHIFKKQFSERSYASNVSDKDETEMSGRVTTADGKKALYSWIVKDGLAEEPLGEEVGENTNVFVVYASGEEERVGPEIVRANTATAAVSAFLFEYDFNLGDKLLPEEVEIKNGAAEGKLSVTTWNIGNSGANDKNPRFKLKPFGLSTIQSGFNLQTWEPV